MLILFFNKFLNMQHRQIRLHHMAWGLKEYFFYFLKWEEKKKIWTKITKRFKARETFHFFFFLFNGSKKNIWTITKKFKTPNTSAKRRRLQIGPPVLCSSFFFFFFWRMQFYVIIYVENLGTVLRRYFLDSSFKILSCRFFFHKIEVLFLIK